MKVTAPEALTVRPLPEICQAARQANCGECWQVPGKPCTAGPEGDHVARYAASVLAATALDSSTTPEEAAEKVRGLFAGLAEAGYGFPPECQAGVLSELAAMGAAS